jgi:2,3-dihydroxybenzoate-AMP ligase
LPRRRPKYENLIFQLSQVREVSLVAMPDPVFGEKACACMVLQLGTELTFGDLTAHLRAQQIASFKLPNGSKSWRHSRSALPERF